MIKNKMDNKKKINIDLLINISVLILGLLGSSLFDALTNSILKTELRIVVIVTIFGCIVLVITATIMHKVLGQVADLNRTSLEVIGDSIHTIADRVYPSFELLPYEGIRNSFMVMMDLLKDAKDVVVLDYFPWGGTIDQHQDEDNSDFKKYYNALDAFMERGGHYLRLVQLRDGGTSSTLHEKVIGDPVVTTHLNKMVDMSQQPHSSVSLKTCQVYMPNISFMIIDGHYLDWEIASINTKKTFEFSKDFFLEDPNKKVIQEFESIIDQINNQSTPVRKIA